MFSLQYGKADREIMLYQDETENERFNQNIAMAVMSDGFIYVSDTALRKIMKFNSYGDLLMKYDLEEMSGPCKITVDGNQRVYASVILSPDCQQWDDDLKMMLTDAVLCYDEHGNKTGTLYQDSSTARPFPMITRLECTENGDIVAVCTTVSGKSVFWFGNNGELVHSAEFNAADIPDLPETPCIKVLEDISPSKSDLTLFLKVNYYADSPDFQFCRSKVYKYDIQQEKFTDSYALPEIYFRDDGERYETMYQLLGVNGKDRIFFTGCTGGNMYNLMVLSDKGQPVLKTDISSKISNTIYENISLNQNGMITGIAATEEKTDILWWLTDRLLRH